uniref:Uncharacterized protein n=1 Tax=viral metagenome TaxID=1070528 RepID=A0A6C0BP67_9ZZZZ
MDMLPQVFTYSSCQSDTTITIYSNRLSSFIYLSEVLELNHQ